MIYFYASSFMALCLWGMAFTDFFIKPIFNQYIWRLNARIYGGSMLLLFLIGCLAVAL